MNKLMDGYDVVSEVDTRGIKVLHPRLTYRVYRYLRSKIGKPIKVYKFGYPDYKSMIKKHPELK